MAKTKKQKAKAKAKVKLDRFRCSPKSNRGKLNRVLSPTPRTFAELKKLAKSPCDAEHLVKLLKRKFIRRTVKGGVNYYATVGG